MGRAGICRARVVYLLIGWIALTSGKALSTGETVEAVDDLPGGAPLLAAVGLFNYGLYKIYSAAADIDGKGSDGKGRIVRVARAIGGLGYWVLCFIAPSQLFGDSAGLAEAGQASGSGGAKQNAASEVKEAAGGNPLLALIGIAVLGMAAPQLWITYQASFIDGLARAPRMVTPAGQAGYAARALVIGLVGWFIVYAGIDGEPIRNFGDSLAIIRNKSDTLFQLIAVGLLLYGLVSLVIARFRQIADADLVASVRAEVARRT